MRRDICKRIERLEQEAGITATPPPNVFFYFADPGDQAQSGDHAWDRKQSEQGTEFEARILAERETAGCKPPFVVFFS